MGVTFNDTQKEQIKSFMEMGDVAGAQGVILGELNAEFGGAAEAINEAGDGSANLKVAVGNLSETIGTAFLPATRQANSALTELANTMTNNVSSAVETQNFAMERDAEILAETNRLLAEGAAANQFEANAMAIHNVKIQEQTNGLNSAAMSYIGYAKAMQESGQATDSVATSMDELNAAMNTLGAYMGSGLSDAQDKYNEKIAEYNSQLANAKPLEERASIEDKIQKETWWTSS